MKKQIRTYHFRTVLVKQLCLFSLLLLSTMVVKGQDMHFSQFFDTPLYRNPALAGIFDGDIRIQSVYRDQWNSITKAYRTGSISGEYRSNINKTDNYYTIAAQMLYDRAGTVGLSTYQFLPAFNYHKSLTRNHNMYLSFGGMVGIVQKSIDRTKITTNSQFDGIIYDPSLPDGETFTKASQLYPDVSLGVTFNTRVGYDPDNDLFIGAACHHVNQPKNSFFNVSDMRLAPRWVLSMGIRTALGEQSELTVQADYSKQQNHKEVLMGMFYSLRLYPARSNEPDYTIRLGGIMRWQDAFAPVLKVEYKNFALGVSYDFTFSELHTANNFRGGFELSLEWRKFLAYRNTRTSAVRCPKF